MKKRKRRAIRRAIKGKPTFQVGALPYKVDRDGCLRILLITSRETRRFVVPKGWPIKKKSASAAAACEAREEAGVVGRISDIPMGTYRYWKRLPKGFVPVDVHLFPMEVGKVLNDWKESNQRRRKWLKIKDAALLVDEPGLVTLVNKADHVLN